MRENAESVLSYWFGDEQDDVAVVDSQSSLWWDNHPGVAAEMHSRFWELREEAISGFLKPWGQTPRGRLALILLVDMFSRKMFQNSGRAFTYDKLACDWCHEGVEKGQDRELRLVERVFFYLPLQHSERLRDQDQSVALSAALAEGATLEERKQLNGYVIDAQKQRDVIVRFGRFPYRNVLLGRVSTDEELEFMTRRVRVVE